ncbi:DUF1642 domain-containing protein [Lactococcus cremoris]|uniref:DUF1642 domain-containing protein n=1 Tax=Lactococcus lactis subsp. cremoris TaxID=1359 RepID=UPI0021FD0D11|nr:DUF1642 domain-containing protein [Lactococcus cremoris]UXV60049.1 DUF1642 domain-containing protein [Lactococcus cremoris]
MTKFEEELSSLPVSKSTNYAKYWNKAQLLTVFKDWQPQQALPVVPEDVDKAIKYLKTQNNFATLSDLGDILTEKGFGWLNDFQFKDRRFGFGGLNNKLFILSHLAITGYTVEKPQLFYLKNKLTGLWLMQYEVVDKVYPYDHTSDIRNRDTFTQEEIDSMQTGSYELVPVEDGE